MVVNLLVSEKILGVVMATDRQIRHNMDSFHCKLAMVGPSVEKHILVIIDFPELEINIVFPTCWDGINLESVNGKKHVVYSEGCDGEVLESFDECFDFDCPTSHPVKIPEIHLYVRVLEYKGGPHVFSDGTNVSREGRLT